MRDLFDPDALESNYLSFWDGSCQTLFRSANTPESLVFPKLPANQDQLTRMRGNFRELVHGGPRGFRVVVGRDISADRAVLLRLGWQISASGALLWLLGLLGGWRDERSNRSRQSAKPPPASPGANSQNGSTSRTPTMS